MSKHDVAIIGAGPAGVAMAVSLRDRGLRPSSHRPGRRGRASWRAVTTGSNSTPVVHSRTCQSAHTRRGHRCFRTATTSSPTSIGTRTRTASNCCWAPKSIASTEGAGLAAAHLVGRHRCAPGGGRRRERAHAVHSRIPGRRGLHRSGCCTRLRTATRRRMRQAGAGGGLRLVRDGDRARPRDGRGRQVWLAVRTPPNIMLRSLPGGLPGDLVSLPLYHAPVRIADAVGRAARKANLGDLSEFGLPIPDQGTLSASSVWTGPALVDMDVIDAIRGGSIEVVPTVDAFEGSKVVLVDGRGWTRTPPFSRPDTVRGLEPLGRPSRRPRRTGQTGRHR